MTAAIEVLHQGQLTFGELAEIANREHREGETALAEAMEHYRRAGEALLQVRATIPHGQWATWLESNFEASDTTAWTYMRIARFWHEVEADGAETLADARRLLKGKRFLRDNGFDQRDVVREACRLYNHEGYSLDEIALLFGCSRSTAYLWARPEKAIQIRAKLRDNVRRRRAAEKALERAQPQQAIKRALVKEGEAFNEAYAVITRLDGLLGQARKEAQTREKREAINEAHALRDKMMDTLVRALGVS